MFRFAPIDSLQHLLYNMLLILMILIFIEVVISNIIAFGGKLSPYHPFVKFVRSIVNPVINPIRRIMPPPYKTGNLDFSPMIAMILVSVLSNLLR